MEPSEIWINTPPKTVLKALRFIVNQTKNCKTNCVENS